MRSIIGPELSTVNNNINNNPRDKERSIQSFKKISICYNYHILYDILLYSQWEVFFSLILWQSQWAYEVALVEKLAIIDH